MEALAFSTDRVIRRNNPVPFLRRLRSMVSSPIRFQRITPPVLYLYQFLDAEIRKIGQVHRRQMIDRDCGHFAQQNRTGGVKLRHIPAREFHQFISHCSTKVINLKRANSTMALDSQDFFVKRNGKFVQDASFQISTTSDS